MEELEYHGRPLCLLGGGETVVNVVGVGKGGRNQVIDFSKGQSWLSV